MVVEVKDWTHITGGDHERIHIITRDGKPQTLPNPLKQVEQYAYDLNRRFETRAELWEERRGKNYLKFPWQPVIVLPYIARAITHQFEQKAIWPRHLVLGKEDLQNAARLRAALTKLPWRYRLPNPIRPDLLDIVREILDPTLAVIDKQGQTIGTVTRLQDHLIKERLTSQQPQQMMLPEMDFSQESEGISENSIVRLVRGVAGSGKTLVLVRRVQHLRQQYPQSRVAVLTFNRDLADDLAQRINMPQDDFLHVSTF
ncbi:UvrD-helicase domain-containing protein, partial [bacterium]|nr:UvrD-helicase domain-containing protein [bacterium]